MNCGQVAVGLETSLPVSHWELSCDNMFENDIITNKKGASIKKKCIKLNNNNIMECVKILTFMVFGYEVRSSTHCHQDHEQTQRP